MSIQLPGQRICESPTPIRADSTDCQFRAANEVNAEAEARLGYTLQKNIPIYHTHPHTGYASLTPMKN